jgi:hypothetical protein
VLLVLASMVLIPVYVFSNSTKNDNLAHFNSSINFANDATTISDQAGENGNIDQEIVDRFIVYLNQALKEGEKVNIIELNNRLEGFGDHFKDEFLKGLETTIDGYNNQNPNEFLQGQVMLDQWGTWYSANIEKIKIR